MKKIFIILLALLAVASAQSPEKINFQTVVRDNLGVPLANQNLSLRLTVANDSVAPFKSYYIEEFQSLSTDNFGLLNVHIGSGVPDLNNADPFSEINWGEGTLYLHMEVNTGNGYTSLGHMSFTSVPGAFHSNLADSVKNVHLSQMDDVHLNGLADGNVLKYNLANDRWEPGVDGSSLWSLNGNRIYYNADNVGIGTSNPTTGLTLGSTYEMAFATHFNPASQRDLLSLFGTSYFESNNFVGLGYESTSYLNNQNQQVTARILYNKSQGGYRWYIDENANGGSNASMVLTRDNWLGLGTHTPLGNIHVQDYTDITNNTPYGSFVIGTSSYLALAMDRNAIQAYNSNASSAWLELQPRGGDLKLVGGNGNISVGSHSAQARLHIDNGYDAALGSYNTSGYIMLGSTGDKNVILDNNEIMARDGVSSSDLHLQADGGNLTVGNLSTGHYEFNGSILDANFNNSPTTMIVQSNGGSLVTCSNSSGRMAVGNALSSNAKFGVGHDSWQLRIHNTGTGGNDWFIGASNDNWSVSGNKLVFGETNSSAAGLLVLDGQNDGVAIGTSSVPSNYKLAVDGRIICEELRVRESGFWPDYVFEDDYALKSLEEVEAHIEENKHLPGIPSAAVIESEGIPVGEMQKMMMEKIEELTLYTIEQDKQLKVQQKKIEELEAALKNH